MSIVGKKVSLCDFRDFLISSYNTLIKKSEISLYGYKYNGVNNLGFWRKEITLVVDCR